MQRPPLYLFMPAPGPAATPPAAAAPLLGLMCCPVPDGAEMVPGPPAIGTAEPGSPGCSPPSRLASFPIVSGKETVEGNGFLSVYYIKFKT